MAQNNIHHVDTEMSVVVTENVAKGLEAATEQHDAYDEETRKRLSRSITRKFDLRIMPVCTLMHFCSIIDRSNMGNASVLGMTDELKLSGIKLNIALSVFFATYITFEMYVLPAPPRLRGAAPGRLWLTMKFRLWTALQTWLCAE